MLDKILCVDDDPITLMLCRKVVEKVEFAKEIVTAKNGIEAIECVKNQGYYNMIFMDCDMPEMDGYTAT